MKRSDPNSAFDIIEFCKTSRIQISPAEYLRMNPGGFNKLIEYVHQRLPDVSTKQTNKVSSKEEAKSQSLIMVKT